MEYKKEKVNGHEDYSVDTNGVVYGKNGMPLRCGENKQGYKYVVFCEGGKCRTVSVHRIVACQFLKSDCMRKSVNHIDGDKKNNVVDNLEWVTTKENLRHAVDVLGVLKGSKNVNSKVVIGIGKKSGSVEYRFDSLGEAARFFADLYGKKDNNIKHTIWCVINGKKKSYRGCFWKYE